MAWPGVWRIQCFGPERIEAFIRELDSVYATEDRKASTEELRHGEGGPEWRHYVGYEGDRPVSTGTLFSNGRSGYLAWWFTHPERRGRGHQSAGIRQRAADAFALGCRRAFTGTDFSIQSARNL